MLLWSLFFLSLLSSIFCLRQFGKLLIKKPLFYLSIEYSADALRFERKIKALAYGSFSAVSMISFFACLNQLLRIFERNLS
ncbi:MAG: hypothetical protein CL674_08905 [Bdellovibrionaceae bacterium]|nr:hypothetical protein [Pseudobdellovibrionaceae bacterium]|tara:strand:+ start:9812 stop:10054 length:243 start_codon:yes stop_codon:yes gene_type:complete